MKRVSKSWIMMGAAALAITGAGGYVAGEHALAAPVNPTPTPAPAAMAPRSFADLVDKVGPAVVSIDIVSKAQAAPAALQQEWPFGDDSPFGEDFRRFFRDLPLRQGPVQPEPMRASGSGFFISPDGYILTNNHVVENADEITVKTKDERELKARLIGRDPATDLAVIKVEGARFPYVSFEDRAKPRVGDWVVAVGNPFGLGGTATAGIVSAIGRRNVSQSNYVDYMQIDAPINRGNSGGPTFDIEGRVVGVNTAIFSPSGGSVGIGFDIPADVAASVSQQLIDHGKIVRGYIGAQIQDVTTDIADSLGLKDRKGALVAEVTQDGPAERAGLKSGDVVLDVNGQAVDSASDLSRRVALVSPGQTIRLRVSRNGRAETLSLTSGTRPSEQQLANNSEPSGSDTAERVLGMNLEPSPSGGLKVDGVRAGSDASAKGVRRGDVIRKAGDRELSSLADLSKALAAAKQAGRKDVLVLIARDGRQLFVPLH
ncbi:MAG TPA: Do family serine endopeptidase, partial [Phenylobacterium sp.]|nr:Do family serine endopeptidase [Phenylobacterium sp.]